jgi:hypothetical protein
MTEDHRSMEERKLPPSQKMQALEFLLAIAAVYNH